jgi:hypothetical protein
VQNIRDFQYRAPRFQIDFHFLAQSDDGQFRYGRCYEISDQGLVAWVSEPLNVDTKATLIFTLPGESTEIMVAVIVSRRFGFDHAFAFIPASPHSRSHLHQYLLAQQNSER